MSDCVAMQKSECGSRSLVFGVIEEGEEYGEAQQDGS